MAFDFGDALDTLMDMYGEYVAIVGDGWRNDNILAVMQGPWVGATALGIPINRTEPMATVYSTELEDLPIAVGHHLEWDDRTFRILGIMADDYGATELMLAEE